MISSSSSRNTTTTTIGHTTGTVSVEHLELLIVQMAQLGSVAAAYSVYSSSHSYIPLLRRHGVGSGRKRCVLLFLIRKGMAVCVVVVVITVTTTNTNTTTIQKHVELFGICLAVQSLFVRILMVAAIAVVAADASSSVAAANVPRHECTLFGREHVSQQVRFSFANRCRRNRSHVDHQIGIVSLEEFVSKDNWFVGADATVQLAESPAVELSGKGTELGGFEEFRNHTVREFLNVINDKGLAFGQPRDAEVLVGLISVFNVFHQIHHLFGKR